MCGSPRPEARLAAWQCGFCRANNEHGTMACALCGQPPPSGDDTEHFLRAQMEIEERARADIERVRRMQAEAEAKIKGTQATAIYSARPPAVSSASSDEHRKLLLEQEQILRMAQERRAQAASSSTTSVPSYSSLPQASVPAAPAANADAIALQISALREQMKALEMQLQGQNASSSVSQQQQQQQQPQSPPAVHAQASATEIERQRRVREEAEELERLRQRIEQERRDAELARALAEHLETDTLRRDEELARHLSAQSETEIKQRIRQQEEPSRQALERERNQLEKQDADLELARILQIAEEAKALDRIPDRPTPPDKPPEPEAAPPPVPLNIIIEQLGHGEDLEAFLARVVPLDILERGAKVRISVRNPSIGDVSFGWDDQRFRALKAQWESWQNPRSLELPSSTNALFKLCVSRKLTTGRWIVRAQRSNIDSVWANVCHLVYDQRVGVEAVVVLDGDPSPTIPVYIRTRDFRDGADVWAVFEKIRTFGGKGRLTYVADAVHHLGLTADNRLGPGKSAISISFYAQTKGASDDAEDRHGLSLKNKFAAAQRTRTRMVAAPQSAFALPASEEEEEEAKGEGDS